MEQDDRDELDNSPWSAQSESPVNSWEAAYVRFETPEEEIRKFTRRLRKMGVDQWRRQARIVELFCGRGNGLHALERLGFANIEGVDLSARLLQLYRGTAKCYVSDSRQLPFANQTKDILIVQGGLHHLPALSESLDQTLAEMHRVLQKEGRIIVVEPWLTPFLRFVHLLCKMRFARQISGKVDALAEMINYERTTYEHWLAHPGLIESAMRKHFSVIHESFAWGKWNFVGTPR